MNLAGKLDIAKYAFNANDNFNADHTFDIDDNKSEVFQLTPSLLSWIDMLGEKEFELSNHLGNVLVTVSDRKNEMDDNSDSIIDYYTADVISAQDYYPFGMTMPGRKTAEGYRFGFNGQEKDNQIYGSGNSYTAEYWQYDSRLGRRWNLDPKPIHSESSYTINRDNPILFVDPNGDFPFSKNGEGFSFFKRVFSKIFANKRKVKVRRKKGKEWAYLRKSGKRPVRQSYLENLSEKAQRYKDGKENLKWAYDLYNRIESDLYFSLDVKTPPDFSQTATSSIQLAIQKSPKVYRGRFREGVIPGGMQVRVLKRNKILYDQTGFIRRNTNPIINIKNNQEIKVELSRVQPVFNNMYGRNRSSNTNSGLIFIINVVADFEFRFDIEVKEQ